MEEYLKKQAEKKAGGAKPVAKAKSKDISESSERYSDEFDSFSKSASAMALPKPVKRSVADPKVT